MRAREGVRTLKVVLHKCHLVVVFASAHGLDARTEACNRQDNDVADLLWCLHACEVLPCDVSLASAHVEVIGIVKVGKNGVRPDRRASELNYALVVLVEFAQLLALQRLLCNVRYNVDEYWVTGLRLDGPLAELNAARVPGRPVGAIWIGLDANDHAV